MNTCEHCNSNLVPGSKYCTACGNSVKPARSQFHCTQCDASVSTGKKFCSNCGTPTHRTQVEKTVSPGQRVSLRPHPKNQTSGQRSLATWIVSTILLIGIGIGSWFAMAILGSGSDLAQLETNDVLDNNADFSPLEKLPVVATEKQFLSRKDGGTVALPNGVQVEIPANVLPNDVTLSVEEVQCDGPGTNGIRSFRIRPDMQLKGNATLRFPFENASSGTDAPIVSFYAPGKGWVSIASSYDQENKQIVATTNHFSDWTVAVPYQYPHLVKNGPKSGNDTRTEFEKHVTNPNNPGVTIDVPFYPQGGSQWCWATCSQMLLKHYGVDTEVWDIASYLDAPINEGLNGGDILMNKEAGILTSKGLNVDRSALGFFDRLMLNEYLVEQLDEGKPIWIALTAREHAIVVVGYDRNGLKVHDPSGELIDAVAAHNNSQSPKTLDKNLCFLHITWKDWNEVALARSYVRYDGEETPVPQPVFAHTMVIENKATSKNAKPTFTVHSGAVVFSHPDASKYKSGGNLQNVFKWDGRWIDGYYFDGIARTVRGIELNSPTNSDQLTKFELALNNTSSSNVNVAIELRMDRTLLRRIEHLVPPKTTNEIVDILAKSGGPINFSSSPLVPGNHRFYIRMTQGNSVCDESTINFIMGPKRPAGLKIKKSDGKIKLTWDENIEEGIVYVVWKNGKLIKDRNRPRYFHHAKYEEDDDGMKNQWQVEALHPASGELDYSWDKAQVDAFCEVTQRKSPGVVFVSSHLSEKAKAKSSIPEVLKISAKQAGFDLNNISLNKTNPTKAKTIGELVDGYANRNYISKQTRQVPNRNETYVAYHLTTNDRSQRRLSIWDFGSSETAKVIVEGRYKFNKHRHDAASKVRKNYEGQILRKDTLTYASFDQSGQAIQVEGEKIDFNVLRSAEAPLKNAISRLGKFDKKLTAWSDNGRLIGQAESKETHGTVYDINVEQMGTMHQQKADRYAIESYKIPADKWTTSSINLKNAKVAAIRITSEKRLEKKSNPVYVDWLSNSTVMLHIRTRAFWGWVRVKRDWTDLEKLNGGPVKMSDARQILEQDRKWVLSRAEALAGICVQIEDEMDKHGLKKASIVKAEGQYVLVVEQRSSKDLVSQQQTLNKDMKILLSEVKSQLK